MNDLFDRTKMDWEALFVQQEILWKYPGRGPHAEYTLTKKHSDYYFNSDCLVSNPPLLKKSCQALFEAINKKSLQNPNWIVTYPPFGLSIASSLADLFHCRFGYIKSLDQPEMNFPIQTGETVLFCADDLYSGSSFRKVHRSLIKIGAKLANPLLVIANFSGASMFDKYQVVALLNKNISTWDENNCPLCAAGSAALPARENWRDFMLAAR